MRKIPDPPIFLAVLDADVDYPKIQSLIQCLGFLNCFLYSTYPQNFTKEFTTFF